MDSQIFTVQEKIASWWMFGEDSIDLWLSNTEKLSIFPPLRLDLIKTKLRLTVIYTYLFPD
jgi:hypothetical protein